MYCKKNHFCKFAILLPLLVVSWNIGDTLSKQEEILTD